jgi:pimeloyl-ACP methyl ester carboxylesterase
MKRQIIIGALALASVTVAPDGPALARARTWQVNAVESQIHVNGITIAYRSYGSADRETILLIMGVGGQLTEWPAELPAELVKRGYRVVTYDNRDAGLSTKFDSSGLPDWPAIFAALGAGKSPQIAYSLDDMASDAVGLLDALGIRKAHLAGASMGGMIAQIVATKHPEHSLSLTSIMAGAGNPALPVVAKAEVMGKVPPSPPTGDLAAVRARELALWKALASPGYPEDEATLMQRIERSMARAYYPAGLERQGAAVVTAGDWRNTLKSVSVPTVVLHGAEDPLVPVDAARDVAASIPGAELRVIPGMGHNLPVPLVPVIADAIVSAATRARHATHAGSPR